MNKVAIDTNTQPAKSLTSRVAFNTAIQWASRAIMIATSIVTIGLLTRYLGQEGFGEYTTVMTYLGFFGIVVDMGLYMILLRDLARASSVEAEDIVGNIFGLRIVSGLIILGLAPVIALLLFPYGSTVEAAIAVGAVGFLLISLNQVIASIFQLNLVMWKLMVGEVLGRITILVLTYIFIMQEYGLVEFIAANAAGNVVLFAFSYFYARKYVKVIPKANWGKWKRYVIDAAPLAVVVILGRIYFNIDVVFLGIMRNQQEVGVYGLPYKILEILISFPAIFAGLIFPMFARYGKEKIESLRRVYQKAYDFFLILALPMWAGLVLTAEPIVGLLGGEEFADSVVLMRILAGAVVFIFFSTLSNNVVIAVKEQRKLMWIPVVAVILNVGLNIWLIPTYTYFAVSWITVFTELMVMVMSAYLAWRIVGIFPNLRTLWRVLVAVAAMSLVLWLLQGMSLFLLVPIGGLVYAAVLYLVGGVDRKMIMNVLGKESDK